MELSTKDLKEIERFKSGFPWMDIVAPATPEKGIRVLTPDEVSEAALAAEKAVGGEPVPGCGRVMRFAKFVPASGAASRMFKDLFNKNVAVVNKFVSNIEKFAFYDKSLYAGLEGEQMVDFTLGDEGLGYGSKPKGVLKFHRYPSEIRTAIAEHLVEAQEYMKGVGGKASLVVTISPEHTELFRSAIADVQAEYEKSYGVRYDISLVYQYKWTDTIAVTPDNEPFLKEDGEPLHRPAGHGALIHNLNALEGVDVVSIKNIDNVSVESNLPATALWKKVLMGTALRYAGKVYDYVKKLSCCASEDLCAEIKAFLENEFCIGMPSSYDAASSEEKAAVLAGYLARPLRVCGMVRNSGEPGGGPFIIREKDGSTSLQILEGAQINPDDPAAVACLKASTHFNPVDLVCVLTDVDGKRYDLEKFVDEEAGFISSKSYQGRELRALELPGLWNGSMSRWNTLFVEVPSETFNPVKTVMDLLRPAHQAD